MSHYHGGIDPENRWSRTILIIAAGVMLWGVWDGSVPVQDLVEVVLILIGASR